MMHNNHRMVNRQMILLGQLITLAKLRVPSSRLVQHLLALRSHSGLMRLCRISGSSSSLPDCVDELLVSLKATRGAVADTVYESCISLSKNTIEELENQLDREPPHESELVEIIRATRDEVRELMDWVVLLAGAKPAR